MASTDTAPAGSNGEVDKPKASTGGWPAWSLPSVGTWRIRQPRETPTSTPRCVEAPLQLTPLGMWWSRSEKALAPPSTAEAAAPWARRLLVGANWKCSIETPGAADKLIGSINGLWASERAGLAGLDVCVFPPYIFLDRVRSQLVSDVQVGGQNAWDAAAGFNCTGVVTAPMMHAVGCAWVLLGHSDRRNTLGETDALIAQKVERCLAAGLNVNLTIGETFAVREAGEATKVLLGQLSAAAAGVPADAWGRVAVAYEPVWAIGEGATPCSPEETQRIHSTLRGWVRENVSEAAAAACRFLYTGSVNEKNAASYAVLPDVDGFVVGRAGLDAEKLVDICRTLVRCKKETASKV